MLSTPRVDFLYKQHPPLTTTMERIGYREKEAIAFATKALLKAQLTAGQHTLNKHQFVDVAKRNGWILQIPENLLV